MERAERCRLLRLVLSLYSPTHICYREADGTTSDLTVSVTGVSADKLEMWCWDTSTYRDLEINRIKAPAS